MKTWKLYRNGAATLAERIGKALSHYSIHNGGALPSAVIVNKRNVAETTEVLKALGVDLPVIEDGGPLLGEVWLLVGDNAPGTATPPKAETANLGGSGDLENSGL